MVGIKNVKKTAWLFLIGYFAITILFAFQIRNNRFDYDFEKFFPIDDEETSYFFEHRKKFESDNDFLLIAIANKDGIFKHDFLTQAAAFQSQLDSVSFVTGHTSILTHKEYIFGNSVYQRPYIHLDTINHREDSVHIYQAEELVNTLVSEDGKSLCIFLKHEEYISKDKSDTLINELKALANTYDFDKVYIAGRTIGQAFYIEKMNYEMLLFVSLSAVLVVLFLYIAFKSSWGILIPQIVIFGTVIWLLGLMAVIQQPINIILSTLPSVMFVVGMSDVIHLVSRFLDARRKDLNRIDATRVAVKEVGLATLLTSITTAIGFFSLYFVNVEPIREYGLMIGIGVLLAFVLTFVTLPALFILTPSPKYIQKQKDGHFWSKYLSRWFRLILKKRKAVLISGIGIFIISLLGLIQINANNFLMDDMRESEPLKQDFNYLDAHYGGIRPFELAVELKDTTTSFWDPEILKELESVENYIEKEYDAQIKQSLIHSIKVLNRSHHSGVKEYFKLPERKRDLRKVKKKLQDKKAEKLLRLVLDSTETTLRISGGIPDAGNDAITEKNAQLLAFIKENTTGKLSYHITGTAHLLDKNMSYLSSSLIKGLLVSIGIVAIIMGFVYRSISMLLISIIPNIFPLLMVAGIMGYFGIDLKTSTAIIFTIAFGIAVDDTIHFLGKFKYERLKGRSKLYALKRSYLTTGKAMIITSLILCSGFLLLVLSSFLGTFFMGLLLCLTLIFALILDLTLLPVLILLFYNPKED